MPTAGVGMGCLMTTLAYAIGLGLLARKARR